MISFTVAFLSAFLVALVAAAGMRLRGRMARHRTGGTPVVDDEAVRRILEEGVFEAHLEDPLDIQEIEDEERRFWSEHWDEPEEW